jgi:predicted metal-dependent phosphoesterase TrpH
MIDLHTHSTASDGSFSPEGLVAHAVAEGVSVLALTDHDSVSGNAAAIRAARDAGLGFIPGIELDIEWKPGECHLLGYGIGSGLSAPHESFAPPELAELLVRLNENRRNRNLEIAAKMRASGIDIDLERVEAIAAGGTVGRPHFAQFLVETKVVKNRQQAFDRYLAKDRPFFIDRKSIPLDEGVAAVRAAGGIPVLAHPLSLYVSWGHLSDILANFRDRGVAGIEAWHPAARIVDCERLEALARELGLFVTAGSDFHGAARPDRKIGKTAGRRVIDDRYLPEALLPCIIRPAITNQ